MHLVTQEGGDYVWIPSIMRFIDGQILIETATHSYTTDETIRSIFFPTVGGYKDESIV